MSNVNVNIIKQATQYVIEINLDEREYAADEKVSFSSFDAKLHMKLNNLDYSQLIEGEGLILRNYGELPRKGRFVFKKKANTRSTRKKK